MASKPATRLSQQILVGLNRLPETTEYIQSHLSALPEGDRRVAIINLARYLARAADKKQASATAQHALEAELAHASNGPAAWTTVGTLRLLAGDPEGALIAARNGAQLQITAVEPASLALALMATKGDAAENLVIRHLQAKTNSDIRMAYVRKLLDAQRFGEALEQAKNVTHYAPSMADGWLMRGSLEYQEQQWSASENSLKKYIELSQTVSSESAAEVQQRGVAQAYLLLSQMAENNQRLDEAQKYLNLIDSPQDNLRVQTRKAALLAKQGKLDEALALLQQAPEVQADDARLKITAQAQLLRDFKRFQAAYDVLSAGVKQYPQDMDLLYDLAMSAEKIGHLEEMESLLRKIIANKPDYHHAYNALGYSLADRAQRLPEAKQLIQKALEYSPNDPYILDSLGWVEFKSGNYDEALRILRSAFDAKPDPEISAHLGEVLWTLHRKDDALATWKAGLLLSTDNETLNDTMRRLATP